MYKVEFAFFESLLTFRLVGHQPIEKKADR